MIGSLANGGIASVLALSLTLGMAGCAVWVPGDGGFVDVGVDYYRPPYYGGYVVYYDGSGLPYYYRGGRVYYVPRSYGRYGALVGHYHRYRPEYHEWYRSKGYRYHDYRAPGGRPPPPSPIPRAIPDGRPSDRHPGPWAYPRPPRSSAYPTEPSLPIRRPIPAPDSGRQVPGGPPLPQVYRRGPSPGQGASAPLPRSGRSLLQDDPRGPSSERTAVPEKSERMPRAQRSIGGRQPPRDAFDGRGRSPGFPGAMPPDRGMGWGPGARGGSRPSSVGWP
jgi:hypothetical protein